MAVFGTEVDRPLYGRGPSPGLRFTGYALLCARADVLRSARHWVQRMRYALQAGAYPVQVAVSSPTNAWRWLPRAFQTRAALQTQVALRARERALDLAVMREAALEQENAQLRGLKAALPPLIKNWQLAEIMSVETNPLRQRLVINKGARDGVVNRSRGRRQRHTRPGGARGPMER
jgi:cell shape-determining protein MreC